MSAVQNGDSAPEHNPQAVTIDGEVVTREQIIEAIDTLRKSKRSTAIKQLLLHNPLAKTDYNRIARNYRKAHPEYEIPVGTPHEHAAHQKIAFVFYLEEHLRNIDQSREKPPLLAAEDEVQREAAAEPLPPDDYDARKRVYKQILRRQGQPDFRSKLMLAYSSRCAITGYDAQEALEAAHIRPYRGPASNAVKNGLLLRADIHTLFDLDLLAVDPKTREVRVSQRLSGTSYQALDRAPLAEPASESQRPEEFALLERWNRFWNPETASTIG